MVDALGFEPANFEMKIAENFGSVKLVSKS
jgi:hypothetical protein